MRILLIHNRYRSGLASGENRVVEQEIDLLSGAGHTVIPYTRDSDDIAAFGVTEMARLPGRVAWSREDHHAVSRLVGTSRPDAAHVHNTFPLISPAVIHALAARRVPMVVTLHNFRLFCANGSLFREGRPCERCLGSSPVPGVVHGCYRGSRAATAPIALNIALHRRIGTWDRVSLFVVLSTFARRKVVAGGVPDERVVVKPNSVPSPGRIREGPGRQFLFLGRLSPEKGPDLLLSAWSPDLGTLVVAGDGPDGGALRRKASRLGGSVRFVGHRSPEECSEMLHDARALIVPSRVYEGFPVVVAEAYAHGVPVIAPAHGPFPEIVEPGSTGLLFRAGDPDDLRRRVRELADPRRSVDMGVAARQAYETRYTPEANLAALESIYARAIAGASPAPAPRRTLTTSAGAEG